jgi:uncharacterized repeat protein (TIGR02543 family)
MEKAFIVNETVVGPLDGEGARRTGVEGMRRDERRTGVEGTRRRRRGKSIHQRFIKQRLIVGTSNPRSIVVFIIAMALTFSLGAALIAYGAEAGSVAEEANSTAAEAGSMAEEADSVAAASKSSEDPEDPEDQKESKKSKKSKKVKVKLYANGGKVSGKKKTSIKVVAGKKYGKLPVPKRARHAFKGWHTAKTGGRKVRAETVVDEDVPTALYAWWKKASGAFISFDGLGGDVSSGRRFVKYGKSVGKLPVPKRARYTFVGWYSKPAGGRLYTARSKLTTDEIAMTLYAHWAPHKYSQHDGRWGRNRYLSTISGSGCGPSTMSMAVYTLKSKNVTPGTAAKWSLRHGYMHGGAGRTRDAFFVKYPAKHGIKSTQLTKGNLRRMSGKKKAAIQKKAREEVKKGNWVIAFMGPGHWTHVGHYILWYDTVDGRALVRDPNGSIPSKTRNRVEVLQREAIRYWVIEVPNSMKIRPEKKS